MNADFKQILCWIFVSVSLVACGGGDSDSSVYACTYQKRTSQTCNRYDYGAWTSGCRSFNVDDYTISAQQVCSNLTKGGLYCASSCCIDSEYRSVSLTSGTCP
ncbi:hypothetical protein CATMQ487_05880 [Sphaerotilus microaerophilus]|uniref:Lipoprotein n=1 Tax=Sphaerotilus microaerophilus TaxID=2914710 RepID=A0ABN6PIQ7_9BURK|nr:hypothetical protein CATMQ487_05880 [Sphaerotilus sp. FB-5]